MAFTQGFDLVLGQNLGDVAFEFRISEIAELDRDQVAVHAHHGRHADGQVQIRAALRDGELEECVDSCHNA